MTDKPGIDFDPNKKSRLGMSYRRAVPREERKLREGNIRDPMTGLYNRGYFDKAIAEAENKDEGIGLIFIDIDNYKQLNDEYGHDFGDLVLKGLSRQLNDITRQEVIGGEGEDGDKVVRFGGDEFAILVRNGQYDDKVLISEAERIAKEIQNKIYWVDNNTHKSITVSVGVANRITGETAKEFFKRADNALYNAKKAGRNQVVFAS